jgi:MFS family permease
VPDDPNSIPKKDSFAALRYKDFRSYIGMRFFFTFAYQMQTTVLGFYIYQLTHSKSAIAFIGLSEVIPAVCIALYGGYIADKYEKRKMLLLIFSGVFLSSLVMGTVTLSSMNAYVHTGWILPVLYAMIFCNGVARAFYGPATFIIYANSIPKDIYANGSTWSSSSWQLASILVCTEGAYLEKPLGRVAFCVQQQDDAVCHEFGSVLGAVWRDDCPAAGLRAGYFKSRIGRFGHHADGFIIRCSVNYDCDGALLAHEPAMA